MKSQKAFEKSEGGESQRRLQSKHKHIDHPDEEERCRKARPEDFRQGCPRKEVFLIDQFINTQPQKFYKILDCQNALEETFPALACLGKFWQKVANESSKGLFSWQFDNRMASETKT